eukprot:scaffold42317_cov27-Prasinocladus_malaysianus.AAC.1
MKRVGGLLVFATHHPGHGMFENCQERRIVLKELIACGYLLARETLDQDGANLTCIEPDARN